MGIVSKISILKGIDDNETQKLKKAVEFVFQQSGLKTNIEIANKLLANNDPKNYVFIAIDELSLSKLVNDADIVSVLKSKTIDKKQIILILDDVRCSLLPDYLLYFPAFELRIPEIIDTEEYSNKAVLKSTALIQTIYDIALYLKNINSDSTEKLTIYIGPSDDSTTFEYQKITRELLHRNHNILPTIQNPSAKEIIENQDLLIEMLTQADLSIHFIGHQSIEQYPEKVSPAMRVNEMVAEFCRSNFKKKLSRVIYVPDETEHTTEQIKIKIAQFKSDINILKNAELVQTPVEKLKSIILAKMEELSDKSLSDQQLNQTSDLYLIYTKESETEARQIIEKLKFKGIHYSSSMVDLDHVALLNYHQNQLKTCSGVIVVDNGNSDWLARKFSDIVKAPGWGRKNPFKLKMLIGNIDEAQIKTKFIDDSVMRIKSVNDLNVDQLQDQLQA